MFNCWTHVPNDIEIQRNAQGWWWRYTESGGEQFIEGPYADAVSLTVALNAYMRHITQAFIIGTYGKSFTAVNTDSPE